MGNDWGIRKNNRKRSTKVLRVKDQNSSFISNFLLIQFSPGLFKPPIGRQPNTLLLLAEDFETDTTHVPSGDDATTAETGGAESTSMRVGRMGWWCR